MGNTLLILAILLVALAGIVGLPRLLETRRRAMDDDTRADAPGSFAELSCGVTHYQWHGTRSDRVLILVHGLSTPSWVFDGLIRGLVMMRYHVLTYDLYGRGFSDRPDDDQTMEFHVTQLTELIEALGLHGSFALLGYSMGGQIAATYTARAPDRVDRLILLATAGAGYSAPARNPLVWARNRGQLGDWLWGLLGAGSLRRGARADEAGPTVITDLEARMNAEIGRRGYLGAVLSSERYSLGATAEAAHREIAKMYVPTLAIWAENDDVIPTTALGQLAQWNRGARQVVVPGAAHSLGYTRPVEVLSAIREFVRDVPD